MSPSSCSCSSSSSNWFSCGHASQVWRVFLSSANFPFIVKFLHDFLLFSDYLLCQNGKLIRWSKKKTKMEAMLRSISDEILESKLTAILSSILDAKFKTYEESMTFFNTNFETMKAKTDGLENHTKALADENIHLRSDSPKMKKEISDLRSAIDEQAQYMRRKCLEIRGVPVTSGDDTNEIDKKIGALTDVDINDTDTSISHRIPSSNGGESGSIPPIRHPAIVVKFTNRRIGIFLKS